MNKLFQQLIMGYADHPSRIRCILFFLFLDAMQNLPFSMMGVLVIQRVGIYPALLKQRLCQAAMLSLPAGTAVLQADPQVVS